MFNKQFATDYINQLLKKHKIEVYAWSASSCGRAKVKKRMIKIPKPSNVDKFGVCLHEIFHVIGKRPGAPSFEQEYYCDKYALDILVELGYPTEEWIKRMKWHVMSCIAMAHNRGLNHSKINSDIRAFFSDVRFSDWTGKKAFAGYAYLQSNSPKDIELTQAMSKDDVEMLLNRKGLSIEKSQYDDSTYGRWLVTGNGESPDFGNLSEIVSHYQLSI